MPKKINGHRLTLKEHRMWKHVRDSTGSPAAATAMVKKHIRNRQRNKAGR